MLDQKQIRGSKLERGTGLVNQRTQRRERQLMA